MQMEYVSKAQYPVLYESVWTDLHTAHPEVPEFREAFRIPYRILFQSHFYIPLQDWS